MDIHIKLLADRYFKGQCTTEEAQLVLEWLQTDAGQKYLAACLEEDQHLLDDAHLFLTPVEVPSADMYASILDKIALENTDKAAPDTTPEFIPDEEPAAEPERRFGWGQWYKIAAAVALLLTTTLLLQRYFTADKLVVYTTNFGETARIVLPDSSIVNLNGNSRLEYAANWSPRQTREVKLQGEAYFSVIHKKNHQKFWVTTPGNIKVEVLGTEFNVNSRRQTQVVLASGKVRLAIEEPTRKPTTVIMKPGESVEISAQKDTLLRRRVDAAVFSSWKNDKLLFDNTSVREICRRIEDTFGYRVKVSDPALLQQRITGSVPNQSLEVVLDGLESLLDVRVRKSTKTIHIIPNN